MRINQKRKILDLMTTIEEGFEYARNSEADNAARMLKDCMDGLSFLTSLLSDEPVISGRLQDAIHDVHFILRETLEYDEFISYLNKIHGIMNEARSNVIYDIRTELEIAFMPYKSSMWDSLESIYNAAEKDPHCTCYVVPIPYYEKNAEGQIIRFCYEGNEFPEHLKTIPFELYDFENREPDIIYIHNPFDHYNKLTVVNPRFYSENLAKYTEMLVYVPYYVAGSTEKPGIDFLPSFNNMDKIIVQSQNLKDAYVQSGVDSNKLLNLGSPKLDAMLTVVREPLELSTQWESVLRDRTVILFNTGIADLLSVQTWLEQIVEVINCFIEHRQLALIWRPHPLTEITIKTMRPQVAQAYEQIKEAIRKANNIIVDTSSDIYPAVSASDGIISDYSSVMMQYIVTEKPVLGLLSKKMLEENRSYYSDYLGCYFTNQDVTVPDFIEIVERKEDFKKEERISRLRNSISNSDGTCGEKVHYSIKDEVIKF
ncbi:hypothetical protein D3P09_25960 [Paenibacillus pinisoli]|uniref:CDP-glycerol--glycerophosphate glycerophosphotransferase n=1 Tax=Paenibacillus pinisoli TaxID=1276110 RepID=A0A3A6PKS0_9BACL|nr:CDP-glycerol glycerophosphotransferase family protein [Paenibacillus pinisoli]RJX36951.1 hypothetical protein D3P09_25960 [Paenibacillus pinisoli]